MAEPEFPFLSVYDQMRKRTDMENRENEAWPWHALSHVVPDESNTDAAALDYLIAQLQSVDVPPTTPLAQQLGADQLDRQQNIKKVKR